MSTLQLSADDRNGIRARGYHRVLRLAHSLADLDGKDTVWRTPSPQRSATGGSLSRPGPVGAAGSDPGLGSGDELEFRRVLSPAAKNFGFEKLAIRANVLLWSNPPLRLLLTTIGRN